MTTPGVISPEGWVTRQTDPSDAQAELGVHAMTSQAGVINASVRHATSLRCSPGRTL